MSLAVTAVVLPGWAEHFHAWAPLIPQGPLTGAGGGGRHCPTLKKRKWRHRERSQTSSRICWPGSGPEPGPWPGQPSAARPSAGSSLPRPGPWHRRFPAGSPWCLGPKGWGDPSRGGLGLKLLPQVSPQHGRLGHCPENGWGGGGQCAFPREWSSASAFRSASGSLSFLIRKMDAAAPSACGEGLPRLTPRAPQPQARRLHITAPHAPNRLTALPAGCVQGGCCNFLISAHHSVLGAKGALHAGRLQRQGQASCCHSPAASHLLLQRDLVPSRGPSPPCPPGLRRGPGRPALVQLPSPKVRLSPVFFFFFLQSSPEGICH